MTELASTKARLREPLLARLRVTFAAPDLRTRRRAGRPLLLRPVRAAAKPAAVAGKGQPDASAFPRFTPRPARLAMPAQDLWRFDAPARTDSADMTARRAVLLVGACVIGAGFGAVLLQVLGRGGLDVAECCTLLLSVLLSVWVGFGFVSAAAGFFVATGGHARTAAPEVAVGRSRTAVLLPTYNEDPGLILAAVQSMAEELTRLGVAERYDLFVLSDTRDERIAQAEETGALRLRMRLQDGPRIYYRRRPQNTDRKAGNIAEWVQSQGAGYDYMLVLDADSLMTGAAILHLTAEMDRDPKLGLVQTVPTIVNAETPFARLQQFASRLYGPVFALGQQWWSGDEGNYWGHNALIRVKAFAQSAGLPHLTGRRPFGGHILSHDFVEAALLRRRGWSVRTLASLPGSYEETPPTLLDTAVRDRRWCQGNLQHARLLFAAGLHWVSRMHLLCGILAYLAPALWLGLLVCAAVAWPEQRLQVGSASYREVIGLFWTSLALLAAPKLMALWLALKDREVRRGFGGAASLVAGVLMESLVSLLTTPVMMVMQSVAVVDVLLGRDSGWSAQRREGAELSRKDAWRAHGGHVLLGVFGGIGAFLVSRDFLIWASPVFLSLTLSALLSLHTSRPRAGRALRRRGLFHIPEEALPPPVLERSLELRRAYAAEADTRRRIEALFRDPAAVYEMGASGGKQAGRMRLAA